MAGIEPHLGDVPGLAAHSRTILRELGYDVVEAADGDAALTLIATQPRIKPLFTDVGLPGPFNVRQLADEALKRRVHLKLLFTTGYDRYAIGHQRRLDRSDPRRPGQARRRRRRPWSRGPP